MTALPDGFPRLKDEKPVVERTEAQARGSRNRNAGMRFQRKARKIIERLCGVIAARFRGQLGNEESWHGLPWRVECKYGLKNHPVVTAYVNAREQSERNHAVGDPRPFVFVCGTAYGPTLAVIELENDFELAAWCLASFRVPVVSQEKP